MPRSSAKWRWRVCRGPRVCAAGECFGRAPHAAVRPFPLKAPLGIQDLSCCRALRLHFKPSFRGLWSDQLPVVGKNHLR